MRTRIYPSEAQRKRVREEEEKQGNGVRNTRQGVPNEMDFASTWSSYKERKGNALELGAEEGRD